MTAKRKEQATCSSRHSRWRRHSLALGSLLAPAHAQDAVDVAKAKAEGKVVWYTSTPIEQGQKIADAVPEGDRHQGRDVPLRRLGDPAPLPAGDGCRPRRGRRAHPLRARRRQRARQEGAVRRLQAEEFRQGAGRRQGPERPVRRPAAQPDDALPAQRQSRRRRRAEDLGRPARRQVQGQAGDDRSVVHLAAGVGGRHDVEGARLGLLREAARQRHHDRAGQPAGRPTCSSAASG